MHDIPGVPGVGPKTAAKWIGLYGDLDGILVRRRGLSGALLLMLLRHRKRLYSPFSLRGSSEVKKLVSGNKAF